MFEGLLDVPMGLEMDIILGENTVVPSTVRWCRFGRTGVEFAEPIAFDDNGQIVLAGPALRDLPPRDDLRRTA